MPGMAGTTECLYEPFVTPNALLLTQCWRKPEARLTQTRGDTAMSPSRSARLHYRWLQRYRFREFASAQKEMESVRRFSRGEEPIPSSCQAGAIPTWSC